eukprot:5459953-Pyramimonas_sp.AAC.1
MCEPFGKEARPLQRSSSLVLSLLRAWASFSRMDSVPADAESSLALRQHPRFGGASAACY